MLHVHSRGLGNVNFPGYNSQVDSNKIQKLHFRQFFRDTDEPSEKLPIAGAKNRVQRILNLLLRFLTEKRFQLADHEMATNVISI